MFGEGKPSWTTGAIGWWFCSNFKVLPWICNRTTKNDWTLWHTMDSCASFWIWEMHEAHSYDSESVWCVMCLKLFSIHCYYFDLSWTLLCSHGSCTQRSSHLQRQWPVQKHKDCRDCWEHPVWPHITLGPDLLDPISSVSSFGCANSEVPLRFLGLHRSSQQATQ